MITLNTRADMCIVKHVWPEFLMIKFTSWRIPVAHTFFVLKLVMGFGWLMIRPLVYLEFYLDNLGSRP